MNSRGYKNNGNSNYHRDIAPRSFQQHHQSSGNGPSPNNQQMMSQADTLDVFKDFHEHSRGFFKEMEKNFFGGFGFGDDFFGGGMMSDKDGFGDIFGGMQKMTRKLMDEAQRGQVSSGGKSSSRALGNLPSFGAMEQFGNGGVGMSKTYVYSKSMGEDGTPHEEKYYANRIAGLTKEGEKIGEFEEMYDNTRTREKRLAKERILNDQGRRVIKRKIGEGPEEVRNIYRGINENQVGEFDQRWKRGANSVNLIGQFPNQFNGRQIGFQDADRSYKQMDQPRAITNGSRR